MIALLAGCSMESSQKLASFAVRIDGKTYMYSTLGSFVAEHMLAEGKSPVVMKTRGLVVLGDEMYADPGAMEDIVNVLAGNFNKFPKQEPSFDGYLAAGDAKVYDKDYNQKATETIGVMGSEVAVKLTDIDGKKSYSIRWQRQPDVKAIENCEVKSLKVVSNPYPGETVMTFQSGVVVRLQDIIDFYNPKITASYDAEHEVVYFDLP